MLKNTMTQVSPERYELLVELRNKIEALLQEFASSEGLTVDQPKMKYGPGTFEITALFAFTEMNTVGVDPRHIRDLIKNGAEHGLTVQMVGRHVSTSKGPLVFQGMHASKAVFKKPKGTFAYYDAVVAKCMIESTPNG